MKKVRGWTLFAACFAAACAQNKQLDESTTTRIEAIGGVARSADGLLKLIFESQDRAFDVTIATDRNAGTALSPAYRITFVPATIRTRVAVEYRAAVEDWEGRLVVAQVGVGKPAPFEEGTYDPDTKVLHGFFELHNQFVVALSVIDEERACGGASSCGNPCGACAWFDPACRGEAGGKICGPGGACVRADDAPICENRDGWDDTPGLGYAFILNNFAIAGQDRGFNLDDRCQNFSCADNQLWCVGELGNDHIRQGLLGGEPLLMIELAGLQAPDNGTDGVLTLKFYSARDADDPFFPANNFQVPPGDSQCCQFKINAQSVAGSPPQARVRAPARLDRGIVRTTAPVPVIILWPFHFSDDNDPDPIPPFGTELRLDRAWLSMRLPADQSRVQDGLMGGAVAINSLAQIENPFCKNASPYCSMESPDGDRLIDAAVRSGLQPDIDLDVPADGLERMEVGAAGLIARCIDGDGSIVPPVDPQRAETCALSPRMADGYSIAFTFSGVRASIVGIAP